MPGRDDDQTQAISLSLPQRAWQQLAENVEDGSAVEDLIRELLLCGGNESNGCGGIRYWCSCENDE